MRKITEKEYQKWKLRFEEDSSIIFSLLNILDNNLVAGQGMASKGVTAAAIACSARLLKERHGINWEGFYNWKELFEVEI